MDGRSTSPRPRARTCVLQNTIHWIKSIAIDQRLGGRGRGADEGPERRALQADQQRALRERLPRVHLPLHAGRPKTPLDRRAIGVGYQDASNVTRWRAGAANKRCRGNTWFIPYETIQNRDKDRPHPATFPPRVPEYCVRLHGLARTALMLDPFLGLGNSAIAAARLGVNFVGIEIDRHYLAEAIARVRASL